ncbi:MAG: NAD(P)H:quinone oxidoreductase [Candidatus Methylopumilus sp.]|nr:NAD(P)H:quinone oxidoreductase [Candidatus Methylopumilus sp.]
MKEVLVLYYSHDGAVCEMAMLIARGIESIPGAKARVRTVPKITSAIQSLEDTIPNNGPLYIEHKDLEECIGLAMGSPTRFGNMAAPLKYFIDSTLPLWLNGKLIGKPACVFTSSGSSHGGNESTLLSMQLPLLHLGMVIVGVPYSVPELSSTKTGGTPYGPSHVAGESNKAPISEDEKKICIAMGKRLAETALKLST